MHIEDASSVDISQHNEELKGRLTATEFEVEKKFLQMYRTRGLCRVILTTNSKNILRLETSNRRWAAFECSEELAGNTEYFNKSAQYWSSIRVQQTVLRDLLSLEVSSFSCEKIPQTPYLEHLQGLERKEPMNKLLQKSFSIDTLQKSLEKKKP